jgi:hypothetical protein
MRRKLAPQQAFGLAISVPVNNKTLHKMWLTMG